MSLPLTSEPQRVTANSIPSPEQHRSARTQGFNMLRTLYLLAVIVIVQTGSDVLNEVYNSNGWTPITRDKAFNVLERKSIGQEFDKHIYNVNQNNFVPEKSENNQEIIEEVSGPIYVNYITNRNERQSYMNELNETESYEEKYEKNILSKVKYRKPKVISLNSIHDINNLASTNINELMENIENVPKDKLIKDESVNHYEVTERSESGELLRQQEVFNIHTNKQINKQNETEKINLESNKFTSNLRNILSNYNIKVNDVLPNYEISRNIKRNSPKQQFFLLPIPIRYSMRFNNFATDPMLVVFLSNYGYYLRGQYSNLYGHLDSNIHNKYFGSYKIYSDTDSSQ